MKLATTGFLSGANPFLAISTAVLVLTFLILTSTNLDLADRIYVGMQRFIATRLAAYLVWTVTLVICTMLCFGNTRPPQRFRVFWGMSIGLVAGVLLLVGRTRHIASGVNYDRRSILDRDITDAAWIGKIAVADRGWTSAQARQKESPDLICSNASLTLFEGQISMLFGPGEHLNY